MKALKNLSLLIVITQLGACAVMSKQDCITADWRDVGYKVALDGAIDQDEAFTVREKACAKHGELASLGSFSQGFSDGRVEHCQLSNAVELGVKGHVKTLEHNLCPERHYQGFNNAFETGYRLNQLRGEASYANQALSNINNSIYNKRQRIERINRQINSGDIGDNERERLSYERSRLRDSINYARRELDYHQREFSNRHEAAKRYQNYLYDEYLFSLSDEFVDPRATKQAQPARPNQSEFEDRIDDILNN